MLVLADSARSLDGFLRPWRERAERIALVPTMGNLHAGHLSLCTAAAALADRVVATIFVNPTQFGQNEDFADYPRTLDADLQALTEAGCVDVVFVPNESDIYPHGLLRSARIVMPPLSHELCGATRPGHFDGVAGVVLRLLNLSVPDVLVLGEKDFQQLVLIRWLVEDFHMNVDVVGMPTIRDDDGLALSSRNRYLDAAQRAAAPRLYRELSAVADALRAGRRDVTALEQAAALALDRAGFDVDYVEVRDATSLERADAAGPGHLIVLGAARLGQARLIDNVRV